MLRMGMRNISWIRKVAITHPKNIYSEIIERIYFTHRRWHSNILDVRSFRGADCDSDHYLVVAKDREKLAVRK